MTFYSVSLFFPFLSNVANCNDDFFCCFIKTLCSDLTHTNRMYCTIVNGQQRAMLCFKNPVWTLSGLSSLSHGPGASITPLCPIVVNTSMGQVIQCLFIFEKHTKQCVNTIYLFYI